jgi:polyphosphate kinase
MLPAGLPRFVELPDLFGRSAQLFVGLYDAILQLVERLFPGCRLAAAGQFRVLRDSELELESDPEDLIQSFERALRQRRRAQIVRLEVSSDMPARLVSFLEKKLEPAGGRAVAAGGLLGLRHLAELTSLDRPDLKFTPFRARVPVRLRARDADPFAAIREQDLLVHHPYEAFDPVVSLIRAAAEDPDVVSIKQTLYRTSEKSPIVEALARAAEAGKSVTAIVELKARFDEAANVRWARDLERAGAQVVFGVASLKTHAKLALVCRREGEEFVNYSHIGTGNYNPDTARVYTDVSYLTANAAVGRDIGRIFNFITGSCEPEALETLAISPFGLRDRLLAAVRDEVAHALAGRPAAIWAKCNSLADPAIIEALYEASAAGVEIDLVVRGICCLRPSVPGLSERIRVKSIIGRFLEHSRIYAFGNGYGLPHPRALIYLSSADLMPRNLDRRVETLFPVTEPGAHERLVAQILAGNVQDDAGSWRILPEGGSERVVPADEANLFDAQDFFMDGRGPAGRASRSFLAPASAPANVPVIPPGPIPLRRVV